MFGLEFLDVTIHSDDLTDHLGQVRVDPVMRDACMLGPIAAAGPAAEIFLRNRDEDAGEGFGRDFEVEVAGITLGLHMARNAGHGEVLEAEEMVGGALEFAAHLVINHWPSIAAVAAALLDRGTLTYAECRRIAALQ